jgi:hypothetical protein
MILVIIIDLIALVSLLYIGARRGVEGALPLAAFFLIFFPEESKLPVFGLFDVTTQRFVTIILLLLTLTGRGTSEPRRLPLKWGIVAISLWWTMATLNSIAFVDSLKALLSLFLDYLAIYVIFAKNITSLATVRRVLLGVAAGLILCSVFGTIEAYANWSVVTLFPTEIHRFGSSGSLYMDDARGLRIQSTFGHPILFGSALAMGIPMVLYLIGTAVSRVQKTFLWVGLLFMFVSIFKTSSRGPWIALGFSMVPFFFLGQRKMRRYILVISLLALTVLVARPGVLQTIWDDYTATVDSHSSQGQSYQYRYVLYQLVADRVDESPTRAMLGYGPQSFPYLHLGGPIDGRWTNFVSCDSSFAALLAETGYVGLGLMGLFLFYVLWTTLRTFWRVDRQDKLLCILFFVNLAAFCFEMTNVAILGWGQQTILLWAIIAMTMIYPSLCAAASTASGEHDAADRTEQDDATVGELALVSISSR